MIALAAMGVVAGALTSIAGQGGGLFLLVACTMLVGPHEALAMTAPALLAGNLHRAWVHRAHVERALAARIVAGALPGALLGGLVAGVLPPAAVSGVLVLTTSLAAAKALGWLRFSVPSRALAPAGLAIGGLTGTAGGAGVLLSPLLLSAGLSGARYVGTTSAVATVTHVGRVVAYGTVGLFSEDTRAVVGAALVLAVAIAAGNALSSHIRARLSSRAVVRLEWATLIVCVALSVAGVR